MIKQIKSLLYFPIAYYFRFFAQIQLARWKPRVIVVTGSSGKTTLLHLIESQIQDKARYSHLANSSFGIPFDTLGLRRKDLTPGEWPYLFFAAPFRAFKTPPKEKLYVVEADCDRPNEGKFLASLLKPEVTLWTNVSRTHTMNFDSLVKKCHCEEERRSNPNQERLPHQSADWFTMTEKRKGKITLQTTFKVEDAIAHEFGYFLEETKSLAIVNGNSDLIAKQTNRSKAAIKSVTQKQLSNYKVFKDHTEFGINGANFVINKLLPKESFYSIAMTRILVDYLNQNLFKRHSGKRSASRISPGGDRRFWTSQNDEESKTTQKIKLDSTFSKFILPPGRCSLFKGIKNTTIIDSSYNATPDGVKSILGMFGEYPSDKKWLVLGDMIELGNEEQEEHERLGELLMTMRLEKIILVGPRVSKYTYPLLKTLPPHPNPLPRRERELSDLPLPLGERAGVRMKIENFLMPKDALDYLVFHLRGGESILFKGARFLEGIIEHLLTDKNDVRKLCRREKVWQKRRKQWGL